MIDIISLEKVLLDFIKVLNNKQLENFKKNIFGILNFEDTKNINYTNINNNTIINNKVCNHPRTKNRGYCKRRCINDIYCVFHTKNKYSKKNNPGNDIISYNPDHISDKISCIIYEELENIDKYNKILPHEKYHVIKKNKRRCIYLDNTFNHFQIKTDNPDDIPNKYDPKNNFIPNLIDYNCLDEIDQYNKMDLFGNIDKHKNKTCIYIEDILHKLNNPDNLNSSDLKNNVSEDKNTEISKKTKKTKKKKKRYTQEYKKICTFYEKIKMKVNNIKYDNIKTKELINYTLDDEKNKDKNKETLIYIFNNLIIHIGENENLDDKNNSFNLLISYIYTLANVFETDNYSDKDFLNIKELIENIN